MKLKEDQEYDFLNDPQKLMLNIKEDTRNYVEEEWSYETYI